MKRVAIFFTVILLSFAATGQNIFRFEEFSSPVYYSAPGRLGDGGRYELAVILIHGWNGGVTVNRGEKALREQLPGAFVISPMFPTRAALAKKKVEYDGRAIWNESWSPVLDVPGSSEDDWRGGGDADGTCISSFDVIDAILKQLSDRKLYPNLKRIVLSGFSGGGQFVSRYVAVGKGKVRKGIELAFVVMSPSTMFRYEKDVPWLWGLKDRPRYGAGLSEKKIMFNLCHRRVWYACGDLDVKEKSLDKTKYAMLQGVNRFDRFRNLETYLDSYPEWKAVTSFTILEGIAHESGKAYRYPELLAFIKGDLLLQH